MTWCHSYCNTISFSLINIVTVKPVTKHKGIAIKTLPIYNIQVLSTQSARIILFPVCTVRMRMLTVIIKRTHLKSFLLSVKAYTAFL